MKNFEPRLLSHLQSEHIVFKYYEHKALFTVEEGESIKHTIPCIHTKNLFLTDKRGRYFLVCVESSKRLAINEFRKLVGSKDMSFASAEDMKEILGLTPGSVSLFGLYNYFVSKKEKALQLYVDKDLRSADCVGRHPNRNDATIVLEHDQIEKFLESICQEVILLEV